MKHEIIENNQLWSYLVRSRLEKGDQVWRHAGLVPAVDMLLPVADDPPLPAGFVRLFLCLMGVMKLDSSILISRDYQQRYMFTCSLEKIKMDNYRVSPCRAFAQPARDAEPIPVKCWPIFIDSGSTL